MSDLRKRAQALIDAWIATVKVADLRRQKAFELTRKTETPHDGAEYVRMIRRQKEHDDHARALAEMEAFDIAAGYLSALDRIEKLERVAEAWRDLSTRTCAIHLRRPRRPRRREGEGMTPGDWLTDTFEEPRE